jgi:hypothetical protein
LHFPKEAQRQTVRLNIATQTLDPSGQRQLDLTNQAGEKYGETANAQLNQVSNQLSNPIDFSTLGPAPTANLASLGNAPTANFSSLGAAPVANEQTRQSVGSQFKIVNDLIRIDD